MNQEQKKPNQSKSKNGLLWLIVILLVIVLIAVGFFVYTKYLKPSLAASSGKTTTPSTSASNAVAPTNAPTSDRTAGWKTYTDEKYGVSFKYPNGWPEPKLESNAKSDAMPFVDVAVDWINFNSDNSKKYLIRSVDISPLEDYKTSELMAGDYDKLLNVYNNKDASGAAKLWMPRANAAMTAATAPVYIESTDGKYRGLYYFANIGQDYSTTIDLIGILTNKQSVFQISIKMESDRSAEFLPIEQNEIKFMDYIESLTLASDETIVKEFNSTFQYVIKSVK